MLLVYKLEASSTNGLICEPRERDACTWYGNLQAIQGGNLDINNVRRVPQIGTMGRSYATVDLFDRDTGQFNLAQYCKRTIEYYDQIKNVPKTGGYAAVVSYAEHATDDSLPPTAGLFGEYTWIDYSGEYTWSSNSGTSYTGRKHERIYTYEMALRRDRFFLLVQRGSTTHPNSPLVSYFEPVDPMRIYRDERL